MSTITDTGIMRQMLGNNGVFPGDPPIVTAYAYRCPHTYREQYAVYWRRQDDILLLEFPDAICLFNEGLTPEGRRWLNENS